jgi:bifunctional ADP-heptose synthase (sugar kinase/adenylyltransferase)
VLLPNLREFSRLVNHRVNGHGNGNGNGNGSGNGWINPAALSLIERHEFDALLVTRGKEGMTLFEKDSSALSREDIPAVSQAVFDVTGAGDTSIAVFALCLAAGATRSQAAQLANVAAGIVVSKRGTACVTPEDILCKIRSESEWETPFQDTSSTPSNRTMGG